MSDRPTNLTELAAFFPVGREAAPAPAVVRAVAMRQGETYDDAVRRQDQMANRIEAKIHAKRNAD